MNESAVETMPAHPRWVLLFHKMPANADRPDHWDLMIQSNESLDTWALDKNPIVHGQSEGVRLGQHRIFYLEHEGEVDGGRGQVQRVARGFVVDDHECEHGKRRVVLIESESLPDKKLILAIVSSGGKRELVGQTSGQVRITVQVTSDNTVE